MAKKRAPSVSNTGSGGKQSPVKSGKVDNNDTPPSSAKASVSEATMASESKTNECDDGSQFLKIEEHVGDIFDAPENSVLIHACNCEGSWGGGIAAAFKKNYPNAFKQYKTHCNESSVDKLRGTAFLIEPCEDSGSRKHFVGCLFTSGGKGKTKDKPGAILEQTGPAMRDLLQAIGNGQSEDGIAEVRMCQINSGLFKVPWSDSKATLENIQLESKEWPPTIAVYSRE